MLVNEFPPLPIGGAETQAERLAMYLAKKGWPVWVVTRGASALEKLQKRDGFQVVRPHTLGRGKMRTVTFMFFAIVSLYQMRRQYSILHAHLAFGPAFVAALLGRILGKKVIVKLGGSNAIGDVHVSRNTWRGRLRLTAIRHWADVVVVLTNEMRDEALSIGIAKERIRFLNNGIDANKYYFEASAKEDAKKLLGLTEKTVILFVGRLDAVKSLPTVMDALAQSIKSSPKLHLIIVGDGPERAFLESHAANIAMGKHIIFAGNQKDISTYLQAADIFVLPSLTEGISNALLEAMASGLACITTPVGGSEEVLDHGKYGLTAGVQNVASWAEALASLSSDVNQRRKFGELARQRILTAYDFQVVGAAYEAMYNNLLKELRGDSSYE